MVRTTIDGRWAFVHPPRIRRNFTPGFISLAGMCYYVQGCFRIMSRKEAVIIIT